MGEFLQLLEVLKSTPIPAIALVLGVIGLMSANGGKFTVFDIRQGQEKSIATVSGFLIAFSIVCFMVPIMFPHQKVAAKEAVVEGPLQKRLKAANIMVTGPEASPEQMKTMVRALNRDPSFQALAETSLRVLDGGKFKNPMHLDSVFGHYKRLIKPDLKNPDARHPSANDCTDEAKLKEAFLANWNEREGYGTVRSFDELHT